MDKQVKDLRDKKIVDFKEDDITRVALRGRGRRRHRRQSGRHLDDQSSPRALRPTAMRCARCLSTVRNMRATDFASDAPIDADLVTYGLDRTRSASLVLHGGRTAPRPGCWLGKETDQGLYVEGRRPDRRRSSSGSGRSATSAKGVNDLRDKTVLSFDPGAATAVDVTLQRRRHLLCCSQRTAKWSLAGSDQAVERRGRDGLRRHARQTQRRAGARRQQPILRPTGSRIRL